MGTHRRMWLPLLHSPRLDRVKLFSANIPTPRWWQHHAVQPATLGIRGFPLFKGRLCPEAMLAPGRLDSLRGLTWA